MTKKAIYSILYLFASLLFPIFTIVNCILYYHNVDSFSYIINFNAVGINLLMIEYAFTIWKIIFLLLLVIEIILLIIFPLLSFIKNSKTLYIIQFAIIFLDSFMVMSLPDNYIILIFNIIYHVTTLLFLCKMIIIIDDI